MAEKGSGGVDVDGNIGNSNNLNNSIDNTCGGRGVTRGEGGGQRSWRTRYRVARNNSTVAADEVSAKTATATAKPSTAAASQYRRKNRAGKNNAAATDRAATSATTSSSALPAVKSTDKFDSNNDVKQQHQSDLEPTSLSPATKSSAKDQGNANNRRLRLHRNRRRSETRSTTDNAAHGPTTTASVVNANGSGTGINVDGAARLNNDNAAAGHTTTGPVVSNSSSASANGSGKMINAAIASATTQVPAKNADAPQMTPFEAESVKNLLLTTAYNIVRSSSGSRGSDSGSSWGSSDDDDGDDSSVKSNDNSEQAKMIPKEKETETATGGEKPIRDEGECNTPHSTNVNQHATTSKEKEGGGAKPHSLIDEGGVRALRQYVPDVDEDAPHWMTDTVGPTWFRKNNENHEKGMKEMLVDFLESDELNSFMTRLNDHVKPDDGQGGGGEEGKSQSSPSVVAQSEQIVVCGNGDSGVPPRPRDNSQQATTIVPQSSNESDRNSTNSTCPVDPINSMDTNEASVANLRENNQQNAPAVTQSTVTEQTPEPPWEKLAYSASTAVFNVWYDISKLKGNYSSPADPAWVTSLVDQCFQKFPGGTSYDPTNVTQHSKAYATTARSLSKLSDEPRNTTIHPAYRLTVQKMTHSLLESACRLVDGARMQISNAGSGSTSHDTTPHQKDNAQQATIATQPNDSSSSNDDDNVIAPPNNNSEPANSVRSKHKACGSRTSSIYDDVDSSAADPNNNTELENATRSKHTFCDSNTSSSDGGSSAAPPNNNSEPENAVKSKGRVCESSRNNHDNNIRVPPNNKSERANTVWVKKRPCGGLINSSSNNDDDNSSAPPTSKSEPLVPSVPSCLRDDNQQNALATPLSPETGQSEQPEQAWEEKGYSAAIRIFGCWYETGKFSSPGECSSQAGLAWITATVDYYFKYFHGRQSSCHFVDQSELAKSYAMSAVSLLQLADASTTAAAIHPAYPSIAQQMALMLWNKAQDLDPQVKYSVGNTANAQVLALNAGFESRRVPPRQRDDNQQATIATQLSNEGDQHVSPCSGDEQAQSLGIKNSDRRDGCGPVPLHSDEFAHSNCNNATSRTDNIMNTNAAVGSLKDAIMGNDKNNICIDVNTQNNLRPGTTASADVRQPNKLMCPTCMRIHFPVVGSERILIQPEIDADAEVIGANEVTAPVKIKMGEDAAGNTAVGSDGVLGMASLETAIEGNDAGAEDGKVEGTVNSASQSSYDLEMPPLESMDEKSGEEEAHLPSVTKTDYAPAMTNSTVTEKHAGGSDNLAHFRRILGVLRSGFPAGEATNSGDNAGNNELPSNVMMTEKANSLENKYVNNELPSNPLTHLRDYGGVRVFLPARCPICLDDHNTIVALRCGHFICEEDYMWLGGYLASDKDKLKAAACAVSKNDNSMATRRMRGDLSEVSLTRRNIVTEGESTVASPDYTITSSGVATSALGSRHNAVLSSVACGTSWAWGVSRHCDNKDCPMRSQLHRTLYSISAKEIKYESCYFLGSRAVPDGNRGLWIHKAKDGTGSWPVIKRSKHGNEVETHRVHRETDIIYDGSGFWVVSGTRDNHVLVIRRVQREVIQSVAVVPHKCTIHPSGCVGALWVNVEGYDSRDDELLQKDLLKDGLWLIGHQSKEKIREESCGENISPDGHGNLWHLGKDEELDVLVLKRLSSSQSSIGVTENTRLEFPIGSRVIGCDSSTTVFVFYERPKWCNSTGELMCVTQNLESEQWSSVVIGECRSDTKFASDGSGGLWALVNEGDNCRFWKCNRFGMTPVHNWNHPFASADLIGG